MRVEVVYTSRCKEAKVLADDIAKIAKSYAKPISDFDFDQNIDLLVIGFETLLMFDDKELTEFIKKLSRDKVKNIALFNLFCLDFGQMDRIIKLCQENNLPLLRETYSCKKALLSKHCLDDDIIAGARVYIEDMINICINYY